MIFLSWKRIKSRLNNLVFHTWPSIQVWGFLQKQMWFWIKQVSSLCSSSQDYVIWGSVQVGFRHCTALESWFIKPETSSALVLISCCCYSHTKKEEENRFDSFDIYPLMCWIDSCLLTNSNRRLLGCSFQCFCCNVCIECLIKLVQLVRRRVSVGDPMSQYTRKGRIWFKF